MGRSALIEAAEHGHADIVKLLIEHSANVNWQDQEGMKQIEGKLPFIDKYLSS